MDTTDWVGGGSFGRCERGVDDRHGSPRSALGERAADTGLEVIGQIRLFLDLLELARQLGDERT